MSERTNVDVAAAAMTRRWVAPAEGWRPAIRSALMDIDSRLVDLTPEETKRRLDQVEALAEALAFYADPSSYHAVTIMGDPPCGGFYEDFDSDHGDAFYDREMPGTLARRTLVRAGFDWREMVPQ